MVPMMYGHPSHRFPGRIAVAVLSLDLATALTAPAQLTPDGVFRARDGRPKNLPGWKLDAAIASRVLAKLRARKTPIVVDYEHQTLNADINGQPAPAAGWIDPQTIEYRAGLGLTAPIEWTAKARAMIEAGEYRYLSPVLSYDPRTGEVLDLLHVALTNFPGLDGMAPVAALSGRFDLDPLPEDLPVNREELIKLLGLEATASDEQIQTGLAALKAKAEAADAKDAEIAALKARGPGKPDPAKYVPVETFEAFKAEFAALKCAQAAAEVDGLVARGIADGKLLPAQASWARELGMSNLAALKSYLDKTPAIAALKGMQSGGKPPEGGDGNEAALDDVQLAVCRQMGVDPAEYRKTLAAQAAA